MKGLDHIKAYLHDRTRVKDKNFLGIITGPTGSGKSFAALRIAQEIDEGFNINRIVFNGYDLLKLINSGTLGEGSVIIFDEIQVEMDSRTWQSTINKLLNYLLETFRHKNLIVFFTSPYIDFLDAGARKLIHADFRMCSIDHSRKVSTLKPKFIQYNPDNKVFYRKYLRVRSGRGMRKVKRIKVRMPLKKIRGDYLKKKLEFTSSLNRDIEAKFEKLAGKMKEIFTIPEKETIQILCKIPKNWSLREKAKAVAKEREILVPGVYQCFRQLESKGISLENPVYVSGKVYEPPTPT